MKKTKRITTRQKRASAAGAGLPVLSQRQAAIELGLSERTLEHWRRHNRGPDYLRLSSKRIGYLRSAIEAWRSSRIVRTADTAA